MSHVAGGCRDGYQFPDLVHALRPNPKTHIQEGWRILDFLSSKPESCHMVRLTLARGTANSLFNGHDPHQSHVSVHLTLSCGHA